MVAGPDQLTKALGFMVAIIAARWRLRRTAVRATKLFQNAEQNSGTVHERSPGLNIVDSGPCSTQSAALDSLAYG